MRFPLSLSYDLARYLLKKRWQGEERFPMVLMLEPTHQCNLSCEGCGRIQEYRDTLGQSLTLEECLDAVTECGAPVVTLTGGGPLIYPPILIHKPIISQLIRRFDLTVNITGAQLSSEHGWIDILLSGDEAVVDQAITWLEAEGMQVQTQ